MAWQAAQARAAARIPQRSDLKAQIYAVLTPEQKAALPAALASMQAKLQQRGGAMGEGRSRSRRADDSAAK